MQGSHAYLASSSALFVIDVSTPESPRSVGFHETLGLPRAVAVDDVYAYVADWNGGPLTLRVAPATSANVFIPLAVRGAKQTRPDGEHTCAGPFAGASTPGSRPRHSRPAVTARAKWP